MALINGTPGADTLNGTGQNDTINGGAGRDRLNGKAGNDVLNGDEDNDILTGGRGHDTLNGGTGFDFASYFDASAGLTASLANPSANTGEAVGDIYISIEGLGGSTFNDVLVGDGGGNWLVGQGGADVLDGQGGFDYAAYSSATIGVTASLADPSANTGEAVGDTYISIEGLVGSAFNDVLIGDNDGNWLVGGLGADSLVGGAGWDYAAYFNATAGVTASLKNAAANTGEAMGDTYNGIEALAGSAFNDVLIGDDNGNWLRGNLGADVLNGRDGRDTASYWAATGGLTASLANPGSNTGEAAGDSYVSIENLGGSQFDDILIGNGGDNWFNGEAGADQLRGGAGFDTAAYHNASAGVTASLASPAANTGEAAGDTYKSMENLYGTGFADTLIGDAGVNWLGGNSGDDTLIGGSGVDTLDGGDGLDYASYVTSGAGLTASLLDPSANTGDAAGDTYVSIERLAGSQFNDVLIGNLGDNTLRGNGGGDRLNGAGGFDYASYFGSSVGVKANLANAAGNTGEAAGDSYISIEGISGSRFNDVLAGDGRDNTLLGNAGADVLKGGAGIDTAGYLVATSGVTASLANAAINTGEATGDTYSSIENLAGSGFADILVGDSGNNGLSGGGSGDRLQGGAGNDTLYGGSGDDVLVGGAGRDKYVFDAPLGLGNIDEIKDFNVADDTIQLDNAIFTALPTTGTLAGAAFFIGAAAHDASDRIIYDSATGDLFYDSNGNAAGGSVKIAELSTGLALTRADFLVI